MYWAYMGGIIPHAQKRVGGGRHEVGGGRRIKTLVLSKYIFLKNLQKMKQHLVGGWPLRRCDKC